MQKRAIALARSNAKPVIVATQMLDSMIERPARPAPRPRDVANAVLDGTDAVMLSGETSVGKYPIESVATMARIVATAEEDGSARVPPLDAASRAPAAAPSPRPPPRSARSVGAQLLVAFTQTGDTARRLARYRSPIPLLAFTPTPAVRSQLALTWGVETFLGAVRQHTDEMVRQVDSALLELGRCSRATSSSSWPARRPATAGSTNAMRVHRLGSPPGGDGAPQTL